MLYTTRRPAECVQRDLLRLPLLQRCEQSCGPSCVLIFHPEPVTRPQCNARGERDPSRKYKCGCREEPPLYFFQLLTATSVERPNVRFWHSQNAKPSLPYPGDGETKGYRMLTRKQRWRRVRVIKIYGMGMSPNDGSPYNFTPQRRRAASDSVLLEAFSFQKRLNPPPVQLQNDLTTTHPTSIRSGGASKTSTRPRARSLDTWSFPGLAILKFFIGDGGRSCVGERKFSEGEENCGTNSFGSARSRAGSESHTLQVRASRRGSSSWPRMSESKGRVRFNQQIRVVLVPSRGEMTPFKADVWWGATDYCYFR